MREPNEIEKLLTPLLEATPYELVWVEVSKGGHRTVVRVFIDTKNGVKNKDGINIDDITKASKEISVFLDVEMPLLGNYVLEVSSPGLDRPLMRPEHFPPQLGEKISVNLLFAQDGRRKFKGLLQKVSDDGIDLLVDDQTMQFAFDDIDKAKVIPDIKIGSHKERQNHEH